MAKIHVICVPFPAQGHVTPMLHFAKLLNSNGVHITFLNSDFNHGRLLKSNGPNSLDGTTSFRFETFPDGLPPNRGDVTETFPALIQSLAKNGIEPFVNVLRKVNDPASGRPPVTLIIFDCSVPYAAAVAQVVPDLPVAFFWPASACSYLGFGQYGTLLEKGIVPFKDSGFMTDGSLEKFVDWVPSMKDVRLKDLPSFMRTMDKNDPMLRYVIAAVGWCRGSPIIFNTFDALEHESLDDISKTLTNKPVYSIGPLHTQAKKLSNNNEVGSLGSNFWVKDSQCIQWLDSKKQNSVVYVSFGSVAIMTNEELNEFAWGLGNSNYPFLWVIRKNIVKGGSSFELSPEFLDHVKGRSLIVDWCDQEMVLNHSSVSIFVTHCGWNSTLEGISSGVPLICWPYFGDQQTNCFYSCNRWGVGVELDKNVNRDGVEKQIRCIMEGEKGKSMKKKAMEWKKSAEEEISTGSSHINLNNFTDYLFSLGQK